ncbi:MAG: SMI1/KNR4 family protein [Calditrichia bacterium]
MKEKISAILEMLEKKIEEIPPNCHFNEPADVIEIIDTEVDLGIELPFSYKCFLNQSNGGYISGAKLGRIETDKNGDRVKGLVGAEIFGLDTLKEVYEYRELMNWKLGSEERKPYPFIPFARTDLGELLIFVTGSSQNGEESPVFDACHEEFPDSWGTLYPTFADFLAAYIQSNGYIRSISYDDPTAEDFYQKMNSLSED